MAKLSVNINKLATIRNARGGNNPNLASWVQKIEGFEAEGITVHPRPDERHIKKTDVFEISPLVKTEFNVEGYPSDDFIKLIEDIKPHQCTLVPDPPDALTSNAGWNVDTQYDLLKKALKKLSPITRVSVFVEPEKINAKAAKTLKELGAKRAEIYTEEFAKNYKDNLVQEKYRTCADTLLEAGLELNAGHDLDLNNLGPLIKLIPEIKEVSIGHALICESLEMGMESVIKKYLSLLQSV